jgi:plastocyanin
MRITFAASLAAITLAAGCGSSSSSTPSAAPPPTGTGFFITISGYAFSPANLRVPPGGTVTVVNLDATTHSVTSEAAPNAFTPGSMNGVEFNTGAFTGTKTFVIPSSAASGTTVLYYCIPHTSMMVPANATITIDPSATPTNAPSGGTGGGGGGGGGY